MKFPFNATPEEVQTAPDTFVDSVFASLASDFLVMPKGEGFLEYATFSSGFQALKKVSEGFSRFPSKEILKATLETPVIFIVLRSILGFTPPEWAYLAAENAKIDIPQGAARSLDRKIRTQPFEPLKPGNKTLERLKALVDTACNLIQDGCPGVAEDKLHRFCKVDSLEGLDSVKQLADLGAPYPILLYERFLGRPFAGHRDSVSELIGDSLESAIEDVLTAAGITYRKTKRAERIPNFDQAPDFIIPDEFNPEVIIEAKLTEDDGTARDKATRVIRLCQMAEERSRANKPSYEVIACLAGRGFGVRREDMRQMILHTGGKIFTPKTLNFLVEHSRLKKFRTK